MEAMTVAIGHLTFDNTSYDEQGDVLYLHSGERQAAPTARRRQRATSCASTPPVRSSV